LGARAVAVFSAVDFFCFLAGGRVSASVSASASVQVPGGVLARFGMPLPLPLGPSRLPALARAPAPSV